MKIENVKPKCVRLLCESLLGVARTAVLYCNFFGWISASPKKERKKLVYLWWLHVARSSPNPILCNWMYPLDWLAVLCPYLMHTIRSDYWCLLVVWWLESLCWPMNLMTAMNSLDSMIGARSSGWRQYLCRTETWPSHLERTYLGTSIATGRPAWRTVRWHVGPRVVHTTRTDCQSPDSTDGYLMDYAIPGC